MAEISWVIASLDCLCSVAARSSSCHSDRAGSPPTRGRGAGGRPSLALPRPQPICAPGLLRERPCLPFPVPSLPWRAASRSLRVSVGERQTDKARAWAEVEPWGSGAGGRLMRPQRRCWRAGRSGGLVFPSLSEFPQFLVIHTVKGFGIVNKAEVDVFLEFSCFFDDPLDVGSLISGSFAFSKSSLNIWKFMVHVLLKPGLKNFEPPGKPIEWNT